MFVFKPAFKAALIGYSKQQFKKDVYAGIIVSIVALPLSIALSVASGLNPIQGIYSTIFICFILALLSGSPVQIGGPTGTFLVLTLTVMTKYGFTGLFTVTVLAGIMLIIMGISGLGKIIKFIPYPVLLGFKVGIALIILTTQVKDFFGIYAKPIPSPFLDKWWFYITNLELINYRSFLIGIMTIGIIIIWRKLKLKIPASFIALFVTTLLVFFFKFDLATIGSSYTIHSGFQKPFSGIQFDDIIVNTEIIGLAFSLAILAAMEALLSAVIADGFLKKKHDSNAELIAEGLANITSVSMGGLPGVGAIARTTTNVQNGAKTPIAALVHVLVMTIIVLFLIDFLTYIPLATLAGILFVVAFDMSDIKGFIDLFKAPKSDVLVLLTTVILTVVVDLAFAVQISIILASLLFMKRMIEVTNFGQLDYDQNDIDGHKFVESLPEYPSRYILIYKLNGPFFFGAADRFMDIMNKINQEHQVIILRMRHVPSMDATALHALKHMHKNCLKHHKILILSGVQDQPLKMMTKAGFIDLLGNGYVTNDIHGAIHLANTIVQF